MQIKKVKFVTLLVIFLTGLNCLGQGETKYPNFKTIVESFYKNYEVSKYVTVDFEKRPEGWFVVKSNYGKDKVRELYWDPKKGGYNKLPFDGKKEFNQDAFDNDCNKHLRVHQNRLFDLYPFYGYDKFAEDVINYYQTNRPLTDSANYALGRAYDHYANTLIGAYWGHQDSTLTFNLPFGKNSLTMDQLDTYNTYINKAIYHYRKTALLALDFKVTVGSIKTKVANTYVDSYLQLLKKQNEEEAEKRLKSGIYNRAWIDVAKNYLANCDSNTILITYGDNDTYPLLYVQATEGFRKDVQIVNYSLLATQDYFYHVLDYSKKQKEIKSSFGFDDLKEKIILSTYNGNPMEVFLLSDSKEKLDVANLKKSLGKESLSKEIKFTINGEQVKIEAYGSYLTKGDLFLIDMIAQNYSQRPIAFTSSYVQGALKNLGDYVETKGYISQLNFKLNDKKYNVSKTYENLITKSNYQGFIEVLQQDRLINRAIRVNFYMLANEYVKKESNDTALYVLNFADDILPNARCYYGDLGPFYAKLYLQLDNKNKAEIILESILENIKKEKDIYHSTQKAEIEKEREKLLKSISDIAKENGLNEIEKEVTNLLNG